MRILIVVHGYPPTYTGGAELRAERTARGLLALGHELAVLCVESIRAADGQLSYHEQQQDGVLVRRISFGFTAGRHGFRESYRNEQIAVALEQMIDGWQPDLIHLFSGYLMGTSILETAAARDLPSVVSLTDYWWMCHRVNLVRANGKRCDGPTSSGCARCHCEIYRRFRLPGQLGGPLVDGIWQLGLYLPPLGVALGLDQQALRRQVTLASLRKAERMIAPSQYLADTYSAYGIDPAQIIVARQGVDLALCPLRRPAKRLRFGYLGQIKAHKGIHLLVEAWGRLRGERARSLVFYGSDQGAEGYAAELRQRSRGQADLRWAGALSHDEVWGALAELDVLVIPSRWRENSPNVILEAQAMGVVVVGSDLGGVAELVEHEVNGLRFQTDSVTDLAQQLQRLLDEPDLLGRLRSQPLPFRSFSDELAQLEAVYGELCVTRMLG